MIKKLCLAATISLLGLFGLLTGCASKPAGGVPVEKAPVQPAPAPAAATPASDMSQALAKAAAKAPAPFIGDGWQPLCDGQTLTGWKITDFAGHGPVQCASGLIVLDMGDALTGINWTNDVPTMNYEVALDAMRVEGSDFFCGLTFPVEASHCSLILGGWGGSVVGLSSIDGQDASENQTTRYITFEKGRWYRVRVRVTPGKIEAWLDDDKIVDVTTTGHKISLRFGEIELSKPFGLATWQTTGALREIKLRRLDAAAADK